MTSELDNSKRFDPLGPVGLTDESTSPPEGFNDAETGAADSREQRLTELLDRATRPPAELKLDWGRLRANLAAEPMPGRSRPAREPKRLARPVRWVLFAATSGAVAAAIVLSTMVFVRPPTGPASTGGGAKPLLPPVAMAAEPEVHIGVAPEEAREIIDQPVADAGHSEIRVVFPRRTNLAAVNAPPAKRGNPIVLTDRAPLVGTPYGQDARDADPDMVFVGF